MSWIGRTSAGSYRARWRDPAGGQRSKNFKTKREAVQFLAEIDASRNKGLYVDPRAGRVRFADFLQQWVAGRNHELTSTARDQSIMRTHVVPRWGDVPLVKIDHSSVQAWVAELSSRRAADTVRKSHGLLASVLRLAVKDRLIGHNPCEGVALPSVRRRPAYDQTISRDAFVRQLLPVIPHRYVGVVALGGGAGLRWGECIGLRLDALDLDGGRVHVRRVAVEVRGTVTSKPYPKSKAGWRDVPLPAFAADALREHIETYPPSRTGEVFTNTAGGPLRRTLFRSRVWRPALVRAGLLGKVVQEDEDQWRAIWIDKLGLEQTKVVTTEKRAISEVARHADGGLTFHQLRHSYGTWLVSDGVPINDVQQLMGHEKASTTLDLYVHRQTKLDTRVTGLFDAVLMPPGQKGNAESCT
jgi:integrase